MKSLTTLVLYTLLALCLALFGYSLWRGLNPPPAAAPAAATQALPPAITTPPSASTLPPLSPSAEPNTVAYAEPQPALSTPLAPDAREQPALTDSRIRIAIIIDDVGYNLSAGRQLAALSGPLTLAVLPHSPHGAELAELGHAAGKEIMVHVPMSTVVPRPLDPGGLTAQMSREEFEQTVRGNLDSVPHVRGLNNHMGSELTQLQQPMGWLMQILAREQLYFIDSRTSVNTVAQQTASELQVPTGRRDVFLDNLRTAADLQQQFDTLIRLAREQGSAIAIGHPYPETVAFLQQVLPELADLGVTLVPVSELLRRTTSQIPEEPVAAPQ